MVRKLRALSLPWLRWAGSRGTYTGRRGDRAATRPQAETLAAMTHRANVMPPRKPGRPDGWTPTSEADHFEKCPVCGHMIDCRDLAEVMEHMEPHEAPTKN